MKIIYTFKDLVTGRVAYWPVSTTTVHRDVQWRRGGRLAALEPAGCGRHIA